MLSRWFGFIIIIMIKVWFKHPFICKKKSEEHSARQKSGAKTQQAMFKRKSPAVNVHNIPHYIHVISE